MDMRIEETSLPGVLLVEPVVFGDARGFFMESWNAARYAEAGIRCPFVQDNLSRSSHGVLRGLHLQNPNGQAKLVSVLEGEVFDVAVDVRIDSPHRGKWFGCLLSADNHRQLFIPAGFAHGFCVTGESALFHYKCSAAYDPDSEVGIRWDDPEIGVEWPVDSPDISEKDSKALFLRDVPQERLPRMEMES